MAQDADGTRGDFHLDGLGVCLAALTQGAVLFCRTSPERPDAVMGADAPAHKPAPMMRETRRDVGSCQPLTGGAP